MKFKLEIELGNDAMQTRTHIEHALLKLGQNLAYMSDPPEDGDDGKIRDLNGNTVGQWEVTADQPRKPVRFEYCYTHILGNKVGERIGMVKYNETGYYLTNLDRPGMSVADVDVQVKYLNEHLEIPDEVADSMHYASCFGWHIPAARPAHDFFAQ